MTDQPDSPRDTQRRDFLRGAAGATAAGVVLNLFPPAIQRALAIPAARVTGTIRDVKHVVILMQENRSFDHYFGAMRGVRGFGDRFPIPLPSGKPVWQQATAQGREIQPYHIDTKTTSAQRIGGTPHTWPDAQAAWNHGLMDKWLPAKTERSLGHYQQADIPFQYALANAFTLCDAYHCSQQTGTNPNRLFLWTGTNNPAADRGGPAIVNTFDDSGPASEGYFWTTYPERLEQAGVSWKLYQDMDDNFSDNPLEGFRQFRAALPGSGLAEKALKTWTLEDLAADVRSGQLPQVSWLVAPAKYSEHPGPSAPIWGADYTARVLDALTADPDVWASTVLIVNFDENDGFFDHVPPPAPPALDANNAQIGGSTVDLRGEHHTARSGPSHGTSSDPAIYYNRPYGLGPRVPMYVISPWSRGGWINSQVFDHTSVIRFLEKRFGVVEPNISAWRRAVCGDLTTAFNFFDPNHEPIPSLPDTSDADRIVAEQSRLPAPKPPAVSGAPQQERGIKPSRALPYDLQVGERVDRDNRRLRLSFANSGRVAVVFHVYDLLDPNAIPRRYTVEPGKSLHGEWSLKTDGARAYALKVFAPNGFYREFRGSLHGVNPSVTTVPDLRLRRRKLILALRNPHRKPLRLDIADQYGLYESRLERLGAGALRYRAIKLDESQQWYDFVLTDANDPEYYRRVAGRLETGEHGITDPGLI
ncbi:MULTISPECIES: phospholipase C, phosphocholine-specific [unclassified Lysobacter]|uniref:phosphocholine-specific phospholipase C n=1 Tax=unclassified Lysobacter TaxID=2635362 RepID=UPI001BEC198D|nr:MULTISPECIES: phospholipase C, phosphocholine-specific [unclassified Lysobacter]MBT2746918.1 phospholipase C, phosphocholine-specific [Lysobacter sp. ISL-42]MBT2750621.1 phospholipase C, phosphocholine-specific [Lysobacter sp. ISL-50]MBT2776467.1 phospholipase C, phosphocholine-specific [Lysobacter sp. ISL-54]MBT2780962.1 phospholipase C, phosphocholine-specific [Lysobacter sp. ISL-52]